MILVSTPTENLKLGKTFQIWMDEHSNLRTLCDEGKGKLQWERDIPQDALDNLQSLANSDFKKNLGKIIHDIYLTGHNLFKDMPQGDHKKRAKYRYDFCHFSIFPRLFYFRGKIQTMIRIGENLNLTARISV